MLCSLMKTDCLSYSVLAITGLGLYFDSARRYQEWDNKLENNGNESSESNITKEVKLCLDWNTPGLTEEDH
jgi:hypothetical protein